MAFLKSQLKVWVVIESILPDALETPVFNSTTVQTSQIFAAVFNCFVVVVVLILLHTCVT